LSIRDRPIRRLDRHAASGETKETTMRVMVLVKASKNSETGKLPSPEMLQEMGKFNEALAKAGLLVAGEGLHPTKDAKRIHFAGDRRTVTDGPFSETKEIVAGYWIWKVKSMDEAVEWARKCPNPMPGEESDLDIRPIYEMEEFAPIDPSGELRAKGKAIFEDAARQHKK
jgi:hypothetical protein